MKRNIPGDIKRIDGLLRAPTSAYVGEAAVFKRKGVEFIVLCANADDIQSVLTMIDGTWELNVEKVYKGALVRRVEIEPQAFSS